MLTFRRGRTNNSLGHIIQGCLSNVRGSVFWSTEVSSISAIKRISFPIVGMAVLIEDSVIAEVKGNR